MTPGFEPTREGRLLLVVGLALEARGLVRGLSPAARRMLTVRIVGPGGPGLDRLDGSALPGRPALVLAAGLAGGCGPGLEPGDIVVGDPVGVALEGPRPDGADPAARDRAVRALDAAGLRYRVGGLLTVDDLVTTPAAKARVWRTRSAVAVDMESAHVLAWARRSGFPALAVRAVADGPDEELPSELLATVGADGRMRPGVLARLLGRPDLVRAAWRLGQRSRRALASLARFVRAFVDLPSEP